ncbi:MAG: hypothetical protein AAGD28_22510 [Bacteroidota bacterium]
MSFSKEENKFDIVEHEILEGDQNLAVEKHLNPEAEIYVPVEVTETRSRRKTRKPKLKKVRKNKFGWAFFLCSMFMGIALTATFETPFFIMAGMGLGFLFFVDPIYNKVMEKIDNI